MHESVLRALFDQVLTDEEKSEADDQNRTDAWRTIGFQNKDPRTDFRAGGLLSLLSLYYFAKYRGHLFESMKQSCVEKEDFWLAISSINLTSRLMSYLHMNAGKNMPSSHNVRAGRLQFKLYSEL